MKVIIIFIAVLLVTSLHFAPAVFAQTKNTQSVRTQVYTPEQELAGFKVPDGFVIELVASERDGVINPVDLTIPMSILPYKDGAYVVQGSEANDLGYSVVPMEPGSGFPGIGNDRLRPYQPFMPPLHEFRVGGTGISGTAFADDASGSFPGEFKNVAFLANPITSSCLLCHQVGSKGQNIAPALDGSASRDYEALLTAILNPDAAVESSYAVYRVTKKDGSSVEGYLVNKDARGTTLAFMGGSKVFMETGTIKNQSFLGGRSFMVKGLIDNYTDKQVADLLSYIRTLK